MATKNTTVLPVGQSGSPQGQLVANAKSTILANNGVIGNLQNTIQPVQAASDYASTYNNAALGGQQAGAAGAAGQLAGFTGLGFANAGQANATGTNLLGGLGQLYGGVNAANQAGYGQYQQAIAPYMTPTPGMTYTPISGDPYGIGLQNQALGNFSAQMNGSMDIQAAQAAAAAQAQAQMYYSSAEDQGRQQEAYNQLQGIANGSLDWTSQGAQAYADPQTVDKQYEVFNKLRDAANGGLDQQSQAAQTRVSQETLDKQNQGMDKLWGLTDPSITPQERMMMEIARRGQEQTESASRGAVMSDLQSRGFGGAGAQQTSMLGAQEQGGQERTLADLGAQANAQNRATNALGMYVDAAGKLRSQEFDEAFARAAAGDQMAVNNANRRLQATGMAADQINNMRGASFDEAYKRGLAADQASASNQQTRLSGAGMAGNEANAIRAANDAVGMNNANNQTSVNMFNAGQTNQVNMFNAGEQNRVGIANQGTRAMGAANFGQEANAIRSANDVITMHNSAQQVITDTNTMMHGEREAGRITDLAATNQKIGQGINDDAAAMGSDLVGKGLAENNLAAGRNQAAISQGSENAMGTYGLVKDIANAYRWQGGDALARASGIQGIQSGIAGQTIQNNLNNAQLANVGPTLQMQGNAFEDAKKSLADQDEGGLLGTGILGKNGLLGLKNFPVL